MISREIVEMLTDGIASLWAQLKTNPGAFPRTGKFSDLALDYANLMGRIGDQTALLDLMSSATDLLAAGDQGGFAKSLLTTPIRSIDNHLAAHGLDSGMLSIIDIDSYAVRFNVFNPGLSAPTSAPTLTAQAAGGLTSAGMYRYVVTFYRDEDESGTGSSAATITPGGTNKGVVLTNIPLGPTKTIGRHIWRTTADGVPGTERLIKTLADNTTTTYTDTAKDTDIEFAPASPLNFGCLISPDFADPYKILTGKTFSAKIGVAGQAIVFAPAINTGDGMATYTLGGTGYTDGAAVDTDKYAAVELEVEVVTVIAGGASAPVVTITGLAHDGLTATWTATFDAANPAAGVIMGATNTDKKRCVNVSAISLNANSGTSGKFRVNGILERSTP